jgi:hypothetical protein
MHHFRRVLEILQRIGNFLPVFAALLEIIHYLR